MDTWVKMLFNSDSKDLKHLVSFGDFDQKSELSEVEGEVARYYYYLLLSRFVLIMDEIFWLYEGFTNISEDLNEVYGKITSALITIEMRKSPADDLCSLNFQPFRTLYKDQAVLRHWWEITRANVMATLDKLKIQYGDYLNPSGIYELPLDMEEVFSNFDRLFSQFKADFTHYRTKPPFNWDSIKGIFIIKNNKLLFVPGSQRNQIFSIFMDNLGMPVDVSLIAVITGLSEPRVRTIINQIRQRIIDAHLGDIVTLEPSGTGSYTLKITPT